ncbi:carbohydrate kinase family protein [Mariniphaga sediminis]|uniref:carbohydrate kinase family protein n=1 Tax=Mariniphaga sediminis TaxID=1628158 RepID=UPI00356686B5
MQRSFKVAGIGELLWDLLPQGKQLGGAPFNFAFHAFQSGCQPYVVSAIGSDMPGEEIISRFDEFGLDKSYVQQITDCPTGTVTVSLGKNGIPSYIIHEGVAWDYIHWNTSLELLAKTLDAVCFGSLAQRNQISGDTIINFLKATKQDCLRVFDINLRQSFYTHEIIKRSLDLSSILKLNDDELPVLANLFGINGSVDEQLDILLKQFNLKLIALTKGEKGSILFTQNEKSVLEAPAVKVVDTVGAGDSFTAILIAGLLQNAELHKIHHTAIQAAAFVCTQNGATPKLPDAILKFKKY